MSTHHWDLTKVSRVPSHVYIEFQIGGGCVCWWGGRVSPGYTFTPVFQRNPMPWVLRAPGQVLVVHL